MPMNYPHVAILEWTQSLFSPETFLQMAGGSAGYPWSLVGTVFYAFQNPATGRHAIYECEAYAGSWDFFTSNSSGCEGGISFTPGPLAYLSSTYSSSTPVAVHRCSWTLGPGPAHLDTTDTSICVQGWADQGVLGYAPSN